MRTKTELELKIKELEGWLECNGNHPDSPTIASDLRNLKTQLQNEEYEKI